MSRINVERNSEHEIIDRILSFERELKCFELLPKMKNKIYDFIAFNFQQITGISLAKMYDNDQATLFIVISAFFGSTPDQDFYQSDPGRYPLYTACIAACAANCTLRCLESTATRERIEQFKMVVEHFETISCNILTFLYTKNPSDAEAALEADYTRLLIGDVEDGSKEIMAIAYKGNLKQFLSQKPCRNLLDKRYRHDRNGDGGWLTIKTLITVSFIAQLFYVFVLSYFIASYKVATVSTASIFVYFRGALFFIFLLPRWILVCDSIIQTISTRIEDSLFDDKTIKNCSRIKKLKFSISEQKVKFLRFYLIMMLMVCESVLSMNLTSFRRILFNIATVLSELLYCFLFVIETFSLISLIPSTSFRLLVHLFKKMFKSVSTFTLIFLAIWYSFAVIKISLTRALLNSETYFFREVIDAGKFEIFGEVEDDDKIGSIDSCLLHSNQSIPDLSNLNQFSCHVRSFLLPLIIFAYMFVTAILLVNLLTSKLTSEYEIELRKNINYSGYARYGLIAKFRSTPLPPQFFFIYSLSRLLLFKKITTWLVNHFGKRPWGALYRPRTFDETVNDDIRRLLSLDVINLEEKLKNEIARTFKTPINDESIKQLQLSIQTIFNDRINQKPDQPLRQHILTDIPFIDQESNQDPNQDRIPFLDYSK